MKIEYLADHQKVIPTLARWSYEEWSFLHPGRSLSDVEALMWARCNRESLPLCLVAFEGDKVTGMVALKPADLESRPELTPWLAGLYVDKTHRGEGVGSELVTALEKEAVRLGMAKLYIYTPGAEQFYLRLNWTLRERTEWQGYEITVMEKNLIP